MKQITKVIWNEFIYGGHLLALGLVSIVTLSAILLNIRITWDFGVVIYFLAFAPCLFGRYVDMKKDASTNPEKSNYLEKQAKRIPYVIGLVLLAMIGILVHFDKCFILLFAAGLVLLSFLYDLFLKGLTRRIVGFKNFFMALLFSSLVLMLVCYYHKALTASVWLVALFIYGQIVVGTAFSDIKDIVSDKLDGLRTFVVVLGHKRLLVFCTAVSVLACVPVVLGVHLGLLPNFALILLLVVPDQWFWFMKSRKDGIDINQLIDVSWDSELIRWLLYVAAGKVLLG